MISLIAGFQPLPESVLDSEAYFVLVTFVSVNTVAFGALSIVKLLPPIRIGAWLTSRNRRSETRSIYPGSRP